jgi:hypothetical protein
VQTTGCIIPALTAAVVGGVATPVTLSKEPLVTTTTSSANISQAGLTSVEALVIARTDARRIYRDLDFLYKIDMCLTDDAWHIDFEFKDESANSGGPHYVIDAQNGNILSKRYDQ